MSKYSNLSKETKQVIIERNIQTYKDSMFAKEPRIATYEELRNFDDRILFRNLHGLTMDSLQSAVPTDESRRVSMTIARNIQDLSGYTLDSEMLETLSESTIDSQIEWYEHACSVLADELGIEQWKNSHLFYPNFPEEVMNKSDFELYLNAMIHYTGTYVFGEDLSREMQEAGLIEEKKERIPLLEVFEREPKYLTKKNGIIDIKNLMDDRIHGITMSSSKQDELWEYASLYPGLYDEIVNKSDKEFQSKENEALVAAHLYVHGHSVSDKLLKDSKDILRFISIISDRNGANNGKLGENPEKLVSTNSFEVRLTKEDKQFVKNRMNMCKNLYHDIWNPDQIKYWKKVSRNIDAKIGPDYVKGAFHKLATNDKTMPDESPVTSIHKEYRMALDFLKHNADYQPICDFIKAYPGFSLQHTAHIMNTLGFIASDTNRDEARCHICPTMAEAYKKCDPMSLIKALNYFDPEKQNNEDARIIRNSKGDLVYEVQPKFQAPKYPDKITPYNVIFYAMMENIKDTKEMGTVYMDPNLNGIKAPSRDDKTDLKGVTFAKGSTLSGDSHKNLVAMGISWKNGNSGHVDIDLHATVEFEDGRVEECYFGGLNVKDNDGNKIMIHSGDYTTGDPYGDGKGAQEVIMFDKQALKDAGIKTVTCHIHNFNGSTFDPSCEVRSVYAQKEGSLLTCSQLSDYQRPIFGGEVMEPSQFEQQINVVGKSRDIVPISYDVKNDEFTIVNEMASNIRHQGKDAHVNLYEEHQMVSQVVSYVKNSPRPTLGQIFAAYVVANNAHLVDNIKDADTVFTVLPPNPEDLKEGAKVITALDGERIMNEFLVTQPKQEEILSEHVIRTPILTPAEPTQEIEEDELDINDFGLEPVD